jgi:predicted metal-dependent enzyme (double-stranded beta helix superfamily)
MRPRVSAISSSWVNALRGLIDALPTNASAADLDAFRDEASELAWRADHPTLSAVARTSLRYRRVLLSDPSCHRVSALLIAWPPGHRTPLHDHDGLWGAEIVLEGALAVDEYHAREKAGAAVPVFERTQLLGIGDATVFADRDYVHSCRNLSDALPALSLHIYGGSLDRFSAFHPVDDGAYRVSSVRTDIDDIWTAE